MGAVNKLVRAGDSAGVIGLVTTHGSILWLLLCSSACSDGFDERITEMLFGLLDAELFPQSVRTVWGGGGHFHASIRAVLKRKLLKMKNSSFYINLRVFKDNADRDVSLSLSLSSPLPLPPPPTRP